MSEPNAKQAKTTTVWDDATSKKFFDHIESKKDEYIKRLAEAVAIDSVSGEVARRPKVVEMGHWLKAWIEKLGGTVTMKDIGKQTLEGQEVDLPPVLLGQYGTDPSKKTLCVYGHYDVQPADKSDGWDTEPFVLTEKEGRLFGRGSSDDKGPVLGWLWAIEASQELGLDLPVNIKMVFEGMEESGSVGMEELIRAEAKGFLSDVDCVCISDNYWLGTTKPCITYGLRGICYFFLSVEGSTKDLHSGVFGGTVHEPMVDLVKMMSTLVDAKGNILIDGVNDTVAPVVADEHKVYEAIDFDIQDYKRDAGLVGDVPHPSKVDTLMRRWRFPSLSIHGVEGAFYGQGGKTVIPRKVIPDQDPEDIFKKVEKHVLAEHAKLNSTTKVSLTSEHGGKPWVANFDHPNYVAGRKATKEVYGVEPDLTREGGSIPITLTFEEATGKSVLLLPMGRGDDGAHSQNEKLDVSNYINGIKLLGSYIFNLTDI
ncbi:CNDP dipeptidase 2 [Salpingoeca rosetta]|uniref:CNDP dipeptidase 2 n=1 Tax=Salpingoeca rosetta (strain ATCC 50818 / BSB-021) TaxID=946362 RepID=F2UQL9_SALR5|nr:CNDP dipeptidase 2 [Salpingoeca rosetta]EGD79924.1 CNDP dipeptidase 2 [Salpingoeca rosetta]|eukprot:XP_004988545.1 CNDP dipeptidase 2 [Salpingoeca rosetta]